MASIMRHDRLNRSLPQVPGPNDQQLSSSGSEMSRTPPRQPRLRSSLSAMREKANVQDRIIKKVLQHVVPNDASGEFDVDMPDAAANPPNATSSRRPDLQLTTLSANFRHFNARVSFLFQALSNAEYVYSWHSPTWTLSCLAVYSFVCLNPYLVVSLPIAALLYGVLVPCFVARYPAPPGGAISSESLGRQCLNYTPQGPPLAAPARPRLAKELGKASFRNMRDVQNAMGAYSYAYDQVVDNIVPLVNFSNVGLSSTLFSFLALAEILVFMGAFIVPWRFALLICGWALSLTGHPRVNMFLRSQVGSYDQEALLQLDRWIKEDAIPDAVTEAREVEIFELQRASPVGGWEPCIFSPSPYDVLSPRRIVGKPPGGGQHLADVRPPSGWQWNDQSRWTVDLVGRRWVEGRMITDVEVETEGEHWVHDVLEQSDPKSVLDRWRRRRLVRHVQRVVPAFVT